MLKTVGVVGDANVAEFSHSLVYLGVVIEGEFLKILNEG